MNKKTMIIVLTVVAILGLVVVILLNGKGKGTESTGLKGDGNTEVVGKVETEGKDKEDLGKGQEDGKGETKPVEGETVGGSETGEGETAVNTDGEETDLGESTVNPSTSEPSKTELPEQTQDLETAKARAQNIMATSPTTKEKLKEQLIREGFKAEHANGAVNSINFAGNSDVVKAAKTYYDTMKLPEMPLRKILENDGYTAEQVEIGVRSIYPK